MILRPSVPEPDFIEWLCRDETPDNSVLENISKTKMASIIGRLCHLKFFPLRAFATRRSGDGSQSISSQAKHLCGHVPEFGECGFWKRRDAADDFCIVHARYAKNIHDGLLIQPCPRSKAR